MNLHFNQTVRRTSKEEYITGYLSKAIKILATLLGLEKLPKNIISENDVKFKLNTSLGNFFLEK